MTLVKEWIDKKLNDEDILYFEYSKFNNIVKIGKGGFGEVRSADYGDVKFALKSFLNANSNLEEHDVDKLNELVKELKLLRMVAYHLNINRFLGITKDPIGNYILVLEYANEKDLRGYLKNKFTSLKWKDKIQMAFDVTCGLKCLHSSNIVHRDLHSRNILVNNGRLLIADLGLSNVLTETTPNSAANGLGMVEYIDPQRFKSNNYRKDKKSDIYGLGVLLWEISSGNPPFPDLSWEVIIYNVTSGVREKPIKGTPLKYQQLYQSCWNGDPDLRPDVEKVYEILCQLNSQFHTNEKQEEFHEKDPFSFSKSLNVESILDEYDITSNSNVVSEIKNKTSHISKQREFQVIQDSSYLIINDSPKDVNKQVEIRTPQVVAFESIDRHGCYITYQNSLGYISELDQSFVTNFLFKLVDGLIGQGISFESLKFPGYYLRHHSSQIKLHKNDNTPSFLNDSSFIIRQDENGFFNFESVNLPDHFIMHIPNNELWISYKENTDLYKGFSTFKYCTKQKIEEMNIPLIVTFESLDNCGYYITCQNFLGFIRKLDHSLVANFLFKLVDGLYGQGISFESIKYPGYYLRHQGYQIMLHRNDNTPLFLKDSSFIIRQDENGYFTFESVNFSGKFITHEPNNELWVNPKEDTDLYKGASTFKCSNFTKKIGFTEAIHTPQIATFESLNNPGYYITHQDFFGDICKFDKSFVANFLFKVVDGLDGQGISLESINFPGYYLRHQGYQIKLHENDNTPLFLRDSSFIIEQDENGFLTFESINLSGYFISCNIYNELWMELKEDTEPNKSIFRYELYL